MKLEHFIRIWRMRKQFGFTAEDICSIENLDYYNIEIRRTVVKELNYLVKIGYLTKNGIWIWEVKPEIKKGMEAIFKRMEEYK